MVFRKSYLEGKVGLGIGAGRRGTKGIGYVWMRRGMERSQMVTRMAVA